MRGPSQKTTPVRGAPRRRRFRNLKSVPVLPSMVTLGNLFFGFLAMAKAVDAIILQGSAPVLAQTTLWLFETAALLVFLAMIFDGLDGAVARLTNQTSAFGAQLDSLADVVTFGVAPAFIAKLLIDFHARPAIDLLPANAKLYWAAAAIYVLCAAMRLARYNVEGSESDDTDHSEFVGLPTPAAAAVVCAVIAFFSTQADNSAKISQWFLVGDSPKVLYDAIMTGMAPGLVVLGLLMVSRFPYPHLVATLVRGRHSFLFLATLVVLVFAAAIEWQFALVFLSLTYVASGIVLGTFRLLTRGKMGPPPRSDRLGDDGPPDHGDDLDGDDHGGDDLGRDDLGRGDFGGEGFGEPPLRGGHLN